MSDTIKPMDDFWKRREESILNVRMRQFFERWEPPDRQRSADFHAEFIRLVQTIHQESHALFMQTLTDLASRAFPGFVREIPNLEKRP